MQPYLAIKMPGHVWGRSRSFAFKDAVDALFTLETLIG